MGRIYLNNDWQFIPEFSDEIKNMDCTLELENVRIPHTTKEVPFNCFDESVYQMLCGYRRILNAPEEWKTKRIILHFDGVGHSTEVFINGEKIKEHHCGYTAFSVELTKYIRYGEENVIAVKVDSRESLNYPPFGFVIDYMTFGGIYRDVYIEVKDQDYIEDVFVRAEFDSQAELTETASEVKLVTKINLNIRNTASSAFFIRGYLTKENKKILLGDKPIDSKDMLFTKPLKNINLWSVDKPELYIIEYELYRDHELVDTYLVKFGFRECEFKTDGFYLNRKKVRICGLNRHQSYPYVGYAMPESIQKYDADILKNELGCNAVRTSHYPQSQYFIDRCDEIGLLVFTELPGWQHIGDAKWQEQAVDNVRDMVMQYRNHPSIILWGVRINESGDNDAFYTRTNQTAHELDESRCTGGVRVMKNSNLLEDVYTYNDFIHAGTNAGCEPKKNITSDMNKPYLVSEYNGHMFPTKSFDCEEHRREHAIRHATVLNEISGHDDIVGSFGWCMFDYNTHKDFGSGDRICYHGVMDMFRNPKLASYVYACQQEKTPVLEVSSSMDIGEHPGCNRGFTYIFSNADSVKMYKNDKFIKEYTAKDSPYKNLRHGPMLIDDFIGNQFIENENFSRKQAEKITCGLNYAATHGYNKLSFGMKFTIFSCMILNHMKPSDVAHLYNKYVGDWGGTSTVYRFEAIKDGKVVKTVVKEPMTHIHLETKVSSRELKEGNSYDVSEIRIKVLDQNNNQMYYYSDSLEIKTTGPIEVIGPKNLAVRGGMSGTYIKTIGQAGEAAVVIGNAHVGYEQIKFDIHI